MPCQSFRDHEYLAIMARRECNKLTRILCEVIGNLTPVQLNLMNVEAQNWWQHHQDADKRAAEREARLKKDRNETLRRISSLTRELISLLPEEPTDDDTNTTQAGPTPA